MPGRFTTTNDDRYKFTGHELDSEAGLDLSYAGARYLDSEIGSWLSIDPLADSYPGWSPYNYTMGNPVNMVDPTGMAPNSIAVRPGGEGGFILEVGDTFADVLAYFNYDWDYASLVWESATARGAVSVFDTGQEVIATEEHYTSTNVAILNLHFLFNPLDMTMPQAAGVKGIMKGSLLAMSVSQKLRKLQNILGMSRGQILSLVTNPKLSGLVKQLYKETDLISGGTAGILRDEAAQGFVGGTEKHFKKANDRLRELNNILRKENLTQVETELVQAMIQDLTEAIRKAQ